MRGLIRGVEGVVEMKKCSIGRGIGGHFFGVIVTAEGGDG